MNGHLNATAIAISQLADMYSREHDMWHLADMHLLVNDINSAIERDKKQSERIAELEAGLKKCMELSNVSSSDTYILDSALDEIWRTVDETLNKGADNGN